MSFKKIHVLIRPAHRHSFNEEINHSDGYNGVIKGFKYDNLHPNGAAKALAMSKKDLRGLKVTLTNRMDIMGILIAVDMKTPSSHFNN
uniref:Uncharacterized protein n=1 Tax=Sphaerodactylus townsendi TaxID=933632 RepID=A0ACB8EID0_9SAUR